MTKQLIDGLRIAADWIELGKVEYNWHYSFSCNWGILAQVVLKMTPQSIINFDYADWTSASKCHVTGIKYNTIVAAFLELGIKQEDFINLEFLRTDGIEPTNWWKDSVETSYRNPNRVVQYMRDWANKLEKELLNQSTKIKSIKVK